jgi:hypothetical protein
VPEVILVSRLHGVEDDAQLAALSIDLGKQLDATPWIVPPELAPAGVRQVTWWESLHIWLPEEGRAVVDTALKVIVGWALTRMKDYLAERKAKPPPLSVTLYGPDGKAIKKVDIPDPETGPEESTDLVDRTPPDKAT